jgi:hypothetical protein
MLVYGAQGFRFAAGSRGDMGRSGEPEVIAVGPRSLSPREQRIDPYRLGNGGSSPRGLPALASDRDAREDELVPLPDPTTTPSFTAHIKPLFRATDRESMRFAFDLWSHEDVSRHADAILARLRDGTMPCDGAWPPESIEVFQRWIAAGTPP